MQKVKTENPTMKVSKGVKSPIVETKKVKLSAMEIADKKKAEAQKAAKIEVKPAVKTTAKPVAKIAAKESKPVVKQVEKSKIVVKAKPAAKVVEKEVAPKAKKFIDMSINELLRWPVSEFTRINNKFLDEIEFRVEDKEVSKKDKVALIKKYDVISGYKETNKPTYKESEDEIIKKFLKEIQFVPTPKKRETSSTTKVVEKKILKPLSKKVVPAKGTKEFVRPTIKKQVVKK
jgi:hypothetical protein